ncbi:DUF6644 family protein [Pelagibacterium xiamenense]|uniref:DUF6644 family protein n=1 Tax=Pelagibacterium xiamenense TaxID=2901140 RepID=UPI001E40C128|nr:DUF6644 family protein [Pelagibacterium xiamenense]MCD7058438.1 hypothetical protein [Pelagibacterium xiamenense]
MLEAVEQLPLAQFLRRDLFAYPIVNALHILALAVLFTTALLMDLRILGLGNRLDLKAVIDTLRPLAVGSFGVAVLTGVLLFIVQPLHYAPNPVFWSKIVLVGLAFANAGYFVLARRHLDPGSSRTRLSAVMSILLWTAAILAGRAIGYFGSE